MALNKESKNYCYNVGRTVAIIEIINNLPHTFASMVHVNAAEKLPYQLTEALKKVKHNLQKELLEPADITLNAGQLPSKVMTTIDKTGSYWIGYYHQKSYLADKYKGIFGIEEVTVSYHTPKRVDIESNSDNTISELSR